MGEQSGKIYKLPPLSDPIKVNLASTFTDPCKLPDPTGLLLGQTLFRGRTASRVQTVSARSEQGQGEAALRRARQAAAEPPSFSTAASPYISHFFHCHPRIRNEPRNHADSALSTFTRGSWSPSSLLPEGSSLGNSRAYFPQIPLSPFITSPVLDASMPAAASLPVPTLQHHLMCHRGREGSMTLAI